MEIWMVCSCVVSWTGRGGRGFSVRKGKERRLGGKVVGWAIYVRFKVRWVDGWIEREKEREKKKLGTVP